MFKNYFTIALRNLRKHRGYSAINIFGLALGMAVALLIGLWIWDELSFDHYHSHHSRLAQVMVTETDNGQKETGQATSIPEGMELRTKWTSTFSHVVLASWNYSHILGAGDKKISQAGMFSQPELPGMLTLHMSEGERDALKDPSSILLDESTAAALFGKADPLGKAVRIDNKTEVKVGGVFEDLPRNTTLRETHFLLAWNKYLTMYDFLKTAQNEWGNNSFQVFVELNPRVDLGKAIRAIRDIPRQHNRDAEELTLIPMDHWHLYNEFKNGKEAGGRIQFVWLFGIIGVFVLLLACINFMNLSTARSEKRAREIGIRKTLGSLRIQVIGQLLCESLLFALLGFAIALLLAGLSLPFFNNLAAKSMRLPWNNVVFWTLILGFTLVTGLLSGSYPALYLSGFQPIKVLKGTYGFRTSPSVIKLGRSSFRVGRLASLPRKVLVVLQFTVSVSLIVGTVIVFRQIEYAMERPVGYTRQGLITVPINTPDIYGHYNALRADLLQTGVVENMAESNSEPTYVTSTQNGFDWEGKDRNVTPQFGAVSVTHDFGKTVGWRIKEGRDFSRNFPTDTGGLILNESAVKLVGRPHPVGMTIKWDGEPHKVIGVAGDMVMESPYSPVRPTVFYLDYGWTQAILLRIRSTVPVNEALAKMELVFRRYNPGSPFSYQFTDEKYAQKFSDDQRVGNLAAIFAGLAIIISCLGLVGLASFVAEQRTKEMGVRKVMGASVFVLWRLLSAEFVLLVIVSCVIAMPLSGYYLSGWLQKYEYRTGLSWWIFAGTGLGALFIAVSTVSYQALKAALANPVRSLRTE
jgi:putative ABC transport system permease protein